MSDVGIKTLVSLELRINLGTDRISQEVPQLMF